MVRVNERMEHRGLIWLRPARHGGPADDPAIGKLAIDGVLEAMEPPELALLCETDRRLFDLICRRPHLWNRMEEGMKRLLDEELYPSVPGGSGYVKMLAAYLYNRAIVMENINRILPDQSDLPSVAHCLSVNRADMEALDKVIDLDRSIVVIAEKNLATLHKRAKPCHCDPSSSRRDAKRRRTAGPTEPKRPTRDARSPETSLRRLQRQRDTAAETRARLFMRTSAMDARSRELRTRVGKILDAWDSPVASCRR